MEIELQKGRTSADIRWKSWNIGFCGSVLDDRGRAAVTQVNSSVSRMVALDYDPETVQISIDGEAVGVDLFRDVLGSALSGSVVLETTTLGFVETLLCCRALFDLGVTTFDLVYVEPERYRNPRPRHLLHRRDFELSGDVSGYRAIPGNAILLRDRLPQSGVFFLGYEEARLRRAFEDLQMIRPSTSAVAFGVPAFKPGWEMDAIANNIDVIREQNIRGGLHFCGAENPSAVVEILTELHKGLTAGQRLFVAPIGTKPHGIGVALFVAAYRDVGIIYDHPSRTAGRTDEIANWHMFSVQRYGSTN